MNRRILTREQFEEYLDEHLARLREDYMRRWTLGASRYGEDVDLTSREWMKEGYEEKLDQEMYAFFDEIKEERGL